MGVLSLTSWQQRLISALVLGPASLGLILYGEWPFALFVGVLTVISLYEWVNLSRKAPRTVLFSIAGFLYVVISLWCCYLIRERFEIYYALWFMALVWTSDVGGYLVGKALKGPKMAGKISPNKTWAGFCGALLLPGLVSIALLLIYAAFTGDLKIAGAGHVLNLMFVGAIIGFVGQCGDLLVSFMKRRAGVKDTGHLIPGHGGLLDRIDSMLLAAPVFLLILIRTVHGI